MSPQSEYALEAALVAQLNGKEYASVVLANKAAMSGKADASSHL